MKLSHRVVFAALLVAGCGTSSDAERKQTARRSSGSQLHTKKLAAPQLKGIKAGGGEFTLDDVRGKAAVIVFYRGAFCSFCDERLKQLAAHEGNYDELSARVIAVTLDSAGAAQKAADKYAFDVVSVRPDVFRAWGVWPDGEKLPRPAEFVLDEDGRVVYGHVGRNAGDMSTDGELLGALRNLQGGS